ncbi:MAG: ribbon-helix-helix domain-containing protein [Alphaproteobacteria bacterium]
MAADGEPSAVVKRSVRIAGHPTSVSLEAPFWDELRRIAAARGLTLNGLVTAVDAARSQANLSSALRLLVVADLKRRAGL